MRVSATFLLLAFTCAVFPANEARSQGYGAALSRSFSARSSSANFTSNRIQGRINNQAYGRVGVQGVNLRRFGNRSSGASQASKPFKSLNRGPSVSPYLALSNSLNQVSDYYNIVRPQQEFQRARAQQQRQNEATQRQIAANSHRLNQMAAAPPFSIQGDRGIAPTGHSTTYMAFDNFQSTGRYFTPIQGLEKR